MASSLNRCRYCVSHHAPLAEATGLTAGKVDALAALTRDPLPEDHDFPPQPGFAPDDTLVIDLAHFLVWSGIAPHAASDLYVPSFDRNGSVACMKDDDSSHGELLDWNDE